MKNFFLIAFFTTISLLGQNTDKSCEILFKINTLIQREHVDPKPIDDSLSVYVFDTFIDQLDSGRNLFLKSEYTLLSQKFRLNIDDFIKEKNCSFLSEITDVYKSGLLRNKKALEKINLESINFTEKDTMRFHRNAFSVYLLNENVEKVWRKKIRFEILNDIAGTINNLDSLQINFNALATESKKIIIENEICRINSSLQNQSHLPEMLYNDFCSYFDPHTNYFSNDTKSNFVSTLSKEHLSLGVNVTLNEKNEIIIEDVDPNGPAFQTKKIKKGDQIIAISNLKETLEVSCASLESISNMILSDANKSIILTLKRNSGKPFDVLVEKQVLKDEGNTVYSFIVNKESKTGYIKIPSFYSDFEGNSGQGCAEDVAKEIIKLKKDAIKGLVIDLTDNGGGSMEEAIKLAGMFIDYGPISIVVDKSHSPIIISDPYKGLIYKGPIVLIINGNSASASEFFASILQDYNRALIIGSTSLGKATMQVIVPLDKTDAQNFIKVTVNKFYGIDGKSHQGIGVIPDVELPGIAENITQRENKYPTAFKNDSIKPIVRFRPYVKNSLIQELSKNSYQRSLTNTYFNALKAINKNIDQLIEEPKKPIPLTIESVFEENKTRMNLWEEISNFQTTDLNLNVSNSNYNELVLTMHPAYQSYNQLQLHALKTNQYLNEAVTIIEDFNSIINNSN